MGLEGKYHRAFPSSGSNGIPVGDKKKRIWHHIVGNGIGHADLTMRLGMLAPRSGSHWHW